MFTNHSTQVIGPSLPQPTAVTRRAMLKASAIVGALAATSVRARLASGYQATPVATPGSPPIERRQLCEIVVPPSMMPDNLEKIGAGFWTIDAGVDATIEQSNEAIRGRTLYLESGSLEISAAVDAPFWTKGEADGGDPIVIAAGKPAHLKAGDVFYLPAIPLADLDPAGTVRITNPAEIQARAFIFHLHEAGGQFSGWPDGILDVRPESEVSNPKKTAEMRQHPAVFRLSETIAVQDAAIPQVEDAEFVGYFVLDGTLIDRGFGAGGTTWRNRWPAGQAGWIISLPNVTHDVTVTGNVPARFLELAIFSGGASMAEATPAP